MTNWIYVGYTKVHSKDRRRIIEQWLWKCPVCGNTIRKPFGNENKPEIDCPKCMEKDEIGMNMFDIDTSRYTLKDIMKSLTWALFLSQNTEGSSTPFVQAIGKAVEIGRDLENSVAKDDLMKEDGNGNNNSW